MKLARYGQPEKISSVVRGWLGSSTDPDVLMAALACIEDRSDLPWALGAAEHRTEVHAPLAAHDLRHPQLGEQLEPLRYPSRPLGRDLERAVAGEQPGCVEVGLGWREGAAEAVPGIRAGEPRKQAGRRWAEGRGRGVRPR